MITEVNDYEILWHISRLADSGVFKGLDYNANDLFRYLIERFDSDKIKVFAAIEENNIQGFVICSLARGVIKKTPQVFIDLAYINKKADKSVGPQLMKKIGEYAKSLKINEVCGFSLKGEKGMFDKYGFTLEYKCYKKDLKEEENER